MKITLPYTFGSEVVPPRCRKPRYVRQQASITLTINEVSAEQAPVAIVQHGREWDDDGNEQPTRCEYRWWRSRLYAKHSFQRAVRAEYENQTAAQFQTDPYPYHLEVSERSWDSEGGRSQQERRTGFRKWARSVLFIDGLRWSETGEPRYVIMTFGLGHNHGLGHGTSLSKSNSYNSNISRDRYYRIDQYAEAVAAATQIATRRGDTKALPIEAQDPTRYDVLIPEAVRLCPRKQHGKGCAFINSVESLIESVSDPAVAGFGAMVLAMRS